MLTFLDKVKIYEDDLHFNGIINLNRSQIFELIKSFRKQNTKTENGIGFVEFVKTKIKVQRNNHFNQ